MNIAYYEKTLNNVIYTEFLLVVLAAVNRIYRNVTGRSLRILDVLVEAGLALLVIGVFLGAVSCLAAHIRQEVQTRNLAEDPAFERIEGGIRGWRDSVGGLNRILREIKSFYEAGGTADKMLENGQYERLLRRKEFLDRRRSMYNAVNAHYRIAWVGVLSVVIFQLLIQNTMYSGAVTAVIVLGVLIEAGFLLLGQSIEVKKRGSFLSMMRNLENTELVKRMNNYAGHPEDTMDGIDGLLFQARHVLLDSMVYDKAPELSGAKRKRLYAQIKEIAALNLWRENYHNVTMRKIRISEGTIYLLYDTEEGRESDYRTRQGLISEDYRKLYDILEKNEVLYFGDIIDAEKLETSGMNYKR